MKLQLRYFASVREAVGIATEPWQTSCTTLEALRSELIARGAPFDEALAPSQALRMALNHTMAEGSAALSEGAEVAFFPPVTGG